MKNTKSLAVILSVIVIAGFVISAWFFYKPVSSVSNSPLATNWNTFVDAGRGFTFQYPDKWEVTKCDEKDCIFGLTDRPNVGNSGVPISVRLFVSTTTKEYNAKTEIEAVQKIIDAHYVTPANMGGANADYTKESARYSIDTIRNKEGVTIYLVRYVGKYSIVSDNYYFDTNKGNTALISVEGATDVQKSGGFLENAYVKELVDGVKVF